MKRPEKEKPLPKPPKTPFGRKRPEEQEQAQGGLIADRMAAAMAEGKLEEFLKKEMPDNEYARNLASMMMGMTGIMPAERQPGPPASEKAEGEGGESTEVPEDVREAIEGGDMQGLMAMLRREHEKRNHGTEAPGTATEKSEMEPIKAQDTPTIDKELIDALIQIASDNSVSLDWIVLRAIKVYVEEYKKSGRL